MWLPDNSLIQMVGKIKLSPQQALQTFGLKMKKGGKGVVLQRRNGKILIRTYIPHKKNCTPKIANKFRELAHYAKTHKNEFVHHWNPLAKNLGYHSGYSLFMKINLKKQWHYLKLNKWIDEKPSLSFTPDR